MVGGRRYEVLHDGALPVLPPWIEHLLATARREPPARPASPGGHRRLAAACHVVETAQEGQRNDKLYWAARIVAEIVAGGQADTAMVTEALVSAALAAGLPADEARRTVASGLGSGR